MVRAFGEERARHLTRCAIHFYILVSHGHLDHFGGVARIQMLSGARVATLEEDWQMMEAAAKGPGRGNAPPPLVPKRDMVIKEGDTITLGNTSLKVYKLPGHTPGSPSFEFTVFDGGRPHKAFLFGGPGPRNGVQGAEQFLNSANRLRKIFRKRSRRRARRSRSGLRSTVLFVRREPMKQRPAEKKPTPRQ